MSAISDFGTCKNASVNQTELFQKLMKEDNNIDNSLQRFINFNNACVETGKKALVETQSNALAKEIRAAVDSSISRMQTENRVYQLIINNKNKTTSSAETENAVIVSMYSDRFFRKEESKNWETLTTAIQKSSQPKPGFFESIDTAGIFSFLIFAGLLYAYASTTLNSEKDKNNGDKKV